jgi:plastocyanin
VPRVGTASVVLAIALGAAACATRGTLDARPGATALLGPATFPCGAEHGEGGYARYGVGPMRRGGWQREELEPDHVVIDGQGVNLHGTARVVDGGTIELEMDEDYFAPTVLEGPAGATVTIELHNDGTRGHNFFVPGQGIDLHCGVRAEDVVQVVFPASGVLVYRCRYSATSGMRGVLRAEE